MVYSGDIMSLIKRCKLNAVLGLFLLKVYKITIYWNSAIGVKSMAKMLLSNFKLLVVLLL